MAAYQITRGGRPTLLLMMSECLITIARIVYAVSAKVLSVGHPTVEDWRTGRYLLASLSSAMHVSTIN